MHKLSITLLACCFSFFSNAQIGGSNSTNLITPVGNIGIKTLIPSESLHIGEGTIKLDGLKTPLGRLLYLDVNGNVKVGPPVEELNKILGPLGGYPGNPAPPIEIDGNRVWDSPDYWSTSGNVNGARKYKPNALTNLTDIGYFPEAWLGMKTPNTLHFISGNEVYFDLNPGEHNIILYKASKFYETSTFESTVTVNSNAVFNDNTNFESNVDFNGEALFTNKVTTSDLYTDRLSIGGATFGATSKLAVNGQISANAIKVIVPGSTHPDYVFKKDYKLMSLTDLESFINKNAHLPGVPSAAEVDANNGLELGEMNRILLEKVEELTLYIIELNKKIDSLESK